MLFLFNSGSRQHRSAFDIINLIWLLCLYLFGHLNETVRLYQTHAKISNKVIQNNIRNLFVSVILRNRHFN
jgi:hypothetical protein